MNVLGEWVVRGAVTELVELVLDLVAVGGGDDAALQPRLHAGLCRSARRLAQAAEE